MNRKKTALISGAVLLAASVMTALIFLTEPTATRSGAVQETAMLVDVIEVQRGTFRPIVEAVGTVEPSRDVVLSPRVGGEIMTRSPAFSPGGYVRRGEPLLQIDPADYENILRRRQTDLQLAMSDLSIEMGRQDVARQDYELLNDAVPGEDASLVLREPQLQAVQAQVDAARAAVNQAELDLQRTTIRAPFDAHILTRNVDVGSQVAPGENLGRLVGMDTYWVEAAVPLSAIRRLDIPENGDDGGSAVTIRNRTAWEEGLVRQGQLYRLVGSLEDRTRMARVLVSVPDPLALGIGDPNVPALIIGSFVEVNIEAREMSDVIRLDRDYIRSDDTVWIMEDSLLHIREVIIGFRDPTYAYITAGLEEGDRVVTTNLTTVADGARLRVDE